MIINNIEISNKELNDLFECVCAGGAGGIGAFAPEHVIGITTPGTPSSLIDEFLSDDEDKKDE